MTGRVAVLPQVGHGVRLLVRGAGTVLGEIGWWLAGAWRLIPWAPRRMAAWLTGGVFAVWAEVWSLLAGLAAWCCCSGLWARLWPVSFQQRVAHPSWRRRIRRSVKRSWAGLMEACGLSRRVADRTGVMVRVPALHRIRWEDPDVLVMVPQLMVGQTVDDIVTASERLRVAVGSRQVRVIPNDTHTGCTVSVPVRRPARRGDRRQVPFPEPGLDHHHGGDGGDRRRATVAPDRCRSTP